MGSHVVRLVLAEHSICVRPALAEQNIFVRTTLAEQKLWPNSKIMSSLCYPNKNFRCWHIFSQECSITLYHRHEYSMLI